MDNPLVDGKPARVPVTRANIEDALLTITGLVTQYREQNKITRADVARKLKTTPQALINREHRGMRGLDVIVEYAESVGLDVAVVLTPRKAHP